VNQAGGKAEWGEAVAKRYIWHEITRATCSRRCIWMAAIFGYIPSSKDRSYPAMAECRSGSLKLSIDGTNGFRKERGLSWKWREDLIRKFKGVRTAEFRKMREELKMFFIDAPNVQHGLEIRKIFLTELDLSQHQKTLAKKIEDTMAQRYKFQMPANHEKWYEIRWIEE
jgi:hypothetical protein